MIARRIKPKPYLDTNVILNYIRKRNDDSEILMLTILRRKIKCWTSYYTILELIDKGQESSWIYKKAKDGATFDDILRKRHPRGLTKAELHDAFDVLKKKFFAPFIESEIVAVMRPTYQAWDGILSLLQTQNFSTGDAFHVATALGSNCNVFISNDSDLVKMINTEKIMLASKPKDLEKNLAKVGMRPIIKT
jgi:predicted nucleic acid-binding protein